MEFQYWEIRPKRVALQLKSIDLLDRDQSVNVSSSSTPSSITPIPESCFFHLCGCFTWCLLTFRLIHPLQNHPEIYGGPWVLMEPRKYICPVMVCGNHPTGTRFDFRLQARDIGVYEETLGKPQNFFSHHVSFLFRSPVTSSNFDWQHVSCLHFATDVPYYSKNTDQSFF